MASAIASIVPAVVRSIPGETLASVLDQSVDCVKLVGLDGRIEYMNVNGQCAMEVDDVCAIVGLEWADLWPEEARANILSSLARVRDGGVSRFDAYCPTTKGTPRWWSVSVSPIREGNGEITGAISISRDITEAELARQALETTTAEMRHRLKNSYAMVAGLLSAFSRGTPEREKFAHEMIERLAALGTAQTLFVACERAPCKVSQLIPALVNAFDSTHCSVKIDALSEADVDQGQADAIALVLGELAVNSAKHGALGHSGKIRVSAAEAGGALTILWSERAAKAVEAQSRPGGQGLRLMERIVRTRKGELALTWFDDGLDVEMTFQTG